MANDDSPPVPPENDVDYATLKWQRLQEFQHHHCHSLRISVSNIAAMAGFHPFRSLPEVLMKLVYQGSIGQALLQHDAALLQVEMMDEETMLMDLARKASVETSQALQLAMQVKMGTAKLDTIQKAQEIKQRIVQEAKKTKKLTKEELQLLQEGARSAIDTGYGTFHEDTALDLYELKCGWTVRDRNAEILMWPFQRVENIVSSEEDGHNHDGLTAATVVPMRSPLPCWKRSVDVEADKNDDESARETKRSKTNTTANDTGNNPIEIDDDSGQEKVATPTAEDSGQTMKAKDELPLPPAPPPYFYMLGSVDGIREEMFPMSPKTTTSSLSLEADADDDDAWRIRDVIVECKHRMNKIHPIPPLYEQIQTTAYCLMYQVTEADIIQVIRKDKARRKQPIPTSQSQKQAERRRVKKDVHKSDNNDENHHGNRDTLEKPQSTILKYFSPSKKVDSNTHPTTDSNQASAAASNSSEASASAAAPSQQTHDQQQPEDEEEADEEPELAQVEIAVSRVSLDEPLYQHRYNWDKVVLPRLCSFVDAVYRIRACDEKRYRLLIAVASATTSSSSSDAWNLLHQECPWLQSCDTAFHREVGMGFGKHQ